MSVANRNEATRQNSARATVFGWTDCTRFTLAQFANHYRPEVRFPYPVARRFESDVIIPKRFPDKSPLPPPVDFTTAFDPAPDPANGIFPRLDRRQTTFARPVKSGGHFHVQSFVRSLLIVVAQPTVASLLLPALSPRWISGRFGFVNAMKLFVRSVFARTGWSNELDPDAQLDPPRTESCQTGWTARPERHTIVTANTLGKPVLLEDFDKLFPGSRHRLSWQERNPQTVTTIQITNREKINSGAITCSEPALEVHRPNIIAMSRGA